MKETIEIINQVNEFYNSAWEKLIIVGSVAFAIVGIVLPIVIQWYQKKSLSLSEKVLIDVIKDESEKMKILMTQQIESTLNLEIQKFESKIEKIKYASDAKIAHMQAQFHLEKQDYVGALADLIKSSEYYLLADDYSNLHSVLSGIDTEGLPNVKKTDLDEIKISRNCDLQKVIDLIVADDKKKSMDNVLKRIQTKILKLQ